MGKAVSGVVDWTVGIATKIGQGIKQAWDAFKETAFGKWISKTLGDILDMFSTMFRGGASLSSNYSKISSLMGNETDMDAKTLETTLTKGGVDYFEKMRHQLAVKEKDTEIDKLGGYKAMMDYMESKYGRKETAQLVKTIITKDFKQKDYKTAQ